MPPATESLLSIDQLRGLANEPDAARSQLEALLTSLCVSDEHAQWACEALENCGAPHASALCVLVPLANHDSPLVATWACKLLARMGAEARSAQGELTRVLQSRTEEHVREEAAYALGQFGELSAATHAALADAAIHGGPRLKRLATAALGG